MDVTFSASLSPFQLPTFPASQKLIKRWMSPFQLVTFSASVILSLTVGGCQKQPTATGPTTRSNLMPENPAPTTMDIRIYDHSDNWCLEIFANGSGYLVYGSNDMANFPANTFALDELWPKLQAKAVSMDRAGDHDYSLLFGRVGEGDTPTMGIAPEVVRSLFEKAHQAARSYQANERIDKLWQHTPPS